MDEGSWRIGSICESKTTRLDAMEDGRTTRVVICEVSLLNSVGVMMPVNTCPLDTSPASTEDPSRSNTGTVRSIVPTDWSPVSGDDPAREKTGTCLSMVPSD